MEIFPAIDILDGRCVRLMQGDFARETEYNPSPADQAAVFAEQGAKWLHVVDLDAARSGELTNLEAIAGVCATEGVKVQAGGGVRSVEAADRFMEAGVSRIVVGTAAVEDPDLLFDLALKMPAALSLDVRDSVVATRGWLKDSGLEVPELLDFFAEAHIEAVVVTDIHRDGTQEGPDLASYEEILGSTDIPVIASGGIGNAEHVEGLKGLNVSGRSIEGVIVGRALYEGSVSLPNLLETE